MMKQKTLQSRSLQQSIKKGYVFRFGQAGMESPSPSLGYAPEIIIIK